MAATIGSEMIGAPIYGQIRPERVIGADRREQMCGSLLNRSRSVSAMRDLPMPEFARDQDHLPIAAPGLFPSAKE
jgi:hypothetical protein